MTTSPVSALPVPVELQRGNHVRDEWLASGVVVVEQHSIVCRPV